MTDQPHEHHTDISEFDPLESDSLPDISGIDYLTYDSIPAPTDAGLINEFYTKVLERLYVGEHMASISVQVHRKLAGRIKLLTPADVSEDTQSVLKHAGAAEFLDLAVHTLKISDQRNQWRGARKLSNIALRILLGRAKKRLLSVPADSHAKEVLRQCRIALGRDPRTGVPLPPKPQRQQQ